MTKPGRKRPPRGDAKQNTLAAKDDQAAGAQRDAKADLIARFKAKSRPADADQSA